MTDLDPIDFANARADDLALQLDRARWHLAQVLPQNWDKQEHTREAVAFLGGVAAFARLRQARRP